MKKITSKQISKMLFEVPFESYELLNNDELIWLLKSDVMEERAIAAKFLGEREAMEALPFLCNALSCEMDKCIRIIITDALTCLATLKQ